MFMETPKWRTVSRIGVGMAGPAKGRECFDATLESCERY
ncbi:hypothetical protein SGPA1_40902 [Streptomyces misionensis JCM 4497]